MSTTPDPKQTPEQKAVQPAHEARYGSFNDPPPLITPDEVVAAKDVTSKHILGDESKN